MGTPWGLKRLSFYKAPCRAQSAHAESRPTRPYRRTSVFRTLAELAAMSVRTFERGAANDPGRRSGFRRVKDAYRAMRAPRLTAEIDRRLVHLSPC